MMIISLEDFGNADKMTICVGCLDKAVIAYNSDYLEENLCEEALHLAGSELELPSSLNRIQDVRITFRLKCLFIM